MGTEAELDAEARRALRAMPLEPAPETDHEREIAALKVDLATLKDMLERQSKRKARHAMRDRLLSVATQVGAKNPEITVPEAVDIAVDLVSRIGTISTKTIDDLLYNEPVGEGEAP